MGRHQPLPITLQQGGRHAGSALAHLAGPGEHGGSSGSGLAAAAAWRWRWGFLVARRPRLLYTCTHADGAVVSGAAGSVRGGPCSRGAVAGARPRLLTASQEAGSPSTGAGIRRQGVQAPGARLWAASCDTPRGSDRCISPAANPARKRARAVQTAGGWGHQSRRLHLKWPSAVGGPLVAAAQCPTAAPACQLAAQSPVSAAGQLQHTYLCTRRCSQVPPAANQERRAAVHAQGNGGPQQVRQQS